MSEYLNSKVESIIKKYQPKSAYQLIEEANCKLLYADLDDETGGCTQTNSRCHTIIVNKNWLECEQRFVILHEFSHIKLHPGVSTPFYRSIGLDRYISRIEYEANFLAMQLLLRMQDQEMILRLSKYELLDYLGLPYELERYI
ncbi:ImmA/IrrE family metallo-endopeptidase [Enterococcus gallinarum]|uniref:ImmA/IrrE family metallo-endopeptidase n=1 Tax=Enterococcus gallinarum TaxID=1353 RepID=UPI001F5683AD|nr:ImmA/IrrE family metallo-endopeptidase [Enterococcus gallinarum]